MEWYWLTREEAAALVALKRRLNPRTSSTVAACWPTLSDLETWITEAETDAVNLDAPTAGAEESGVDLGRAL